MDRPKPLSYQSLKSVVQFMDARFRTILAPHFPSLRNVQKLLPLWLDVLKLDKSSFTLDDVKYSFDIVLEKRIGVEKLPYDVTKLGFEDTEKALMPGDILIGNPFRGVQFRHFNRFLEYGEYNSYVLWEVRSGSNKSFVRSDYGIKIRDTIRKQLNKVLGGNHVRRVNHLEIETSDCILRIPKGLKLKIQELTVPENSNEVIDAILPLLDASSFPLKSLSIVVESALDLFFQSEILTTSESLSIRNKGRVNHNWLNLIFTLTQRKIHLNFEIPLTDFISIARNWMEHSRDIGTQFSMQTKSVFDYLNKLKRELKAVKNVFPRKRVSMFFSCYTLPMNSTSELNFYGCEVSNHKEEVTKYNEQPHMIVMEVMPIGSAKPMKFQ